MRRSRSISLQKQHNQHAQVQSHIQYKQVESVFALQSVHLALYEVYPGHCCRSTRDSSKDGLPGYSDTTITRLLCPRSW